MTSRAPPAVILVLCIVLVAGCANLSPGRQPVPAAPVSTATVPESPAFTMATSAVTTTAPAGTALTTRTTVPATSPGVPPVADFRANRTGGKVPLAVSFTDTSTGQPTAWAWNFGDGNTSAEQNPVHVYADPGRFTVRLVAANGAGSNTESKAYYIAADPAFQPPGAAYDTHAPSASQPETVSFFDRSSGPPTRWEWDFGDGGTSDIPDPVHNFPGPGTYVVSLKVSNPAGSSRIAGTVTIG